MGEKAAVRSRLLPVLGEVFRSYGYEGTSVARMTAATGAGKGSLYNAFPGGKEEMAQAVLASIDRWFETAIFLPLRDEPSAPQAIRHMLAQVETYFQSGQRICLVGLFALGDERDRFAIRIRHYFAGWQSALTQALVRAGHSHTAASTLAEETIASIQGALVQARAMQDTTLFPRALSRLAARLLPVSLSEQPVTTLSHKGE
ncbi:TetR/AcrR family transcriptional regulator [Acetobacter senegalensis]|uniref:TetR/AcrR family transcriptional regulator n=1 Tax=Acetobacter senegalensis TaxID=446692 RepID=UPI00128D1AC9|nr:TetR/AcrR family transcriptional regulator [Acetobacter senegalensis]MCG4257007.1 TetR/AcrR family transcriptional regulator [Acetobacter senegalensis]MCG4266855.1 TetR/AcrR family transcriptional regulator [Acetobacter senegalensis]MPQ72463.1 TetR family transcriptional regulator [Acetobacter senegalensis]